MKTPQLQRNFNAAQSTPTDPTNAAFSDSSRLLIKDQLRDGSMTAQNATNNIDDPAFYTAREFGWRTNLSYSTVLRLIARRKLKCMPHLRHKRIPASELERWRRGEF